MLGCEGLVVVVVVIVTVIGADNDDDDDDDDGDDDDDDGLCMAWQPWTDICSVVCFPPLVLAAAASGSRGVGAPGFVGAAAAVTAGLGSSTPSSQWQHDLHEC